MDNPYIPPQSAVADVTSTSSTGTDAPAFFPVSKIKLLVLSFCTFGTYEIYWFYKNWSLIRDRTGEDIRPFPRAIFAVFYCYQLFDRVKRHSPQDSSANLAAGTLAALWIILTLLHRLPAPYGLVTYFAVFALLPVQHAINGINQAIAPDHDPNSRFTAWNWVAIVIGGLGLLLAVIGTFYRSA